MGHRGTCSHFFTIFNAKCPLLVYIVPFPACEDAPEFKFSHVSHFLNASYVSGLNSRVKVVEALRGRALIDHIFLKKCTRA